MPAKHPPRPHLPGNPHLSRFLQLIFAHFKIGRLWLLANPDAVDTSPFRAEGPAVLDDHYSAVTRIENIDESADFERFGEIPRLHNSTLVILGSPRRGAQDSGYLAIHFTVQRDRQSIA